MTSDSAIPNPESNSAVNNAESISSLSDVEVDTTVFSVKEADSAVDEAESSSILPEAEVNSVLLYLKSNSADTNVESNSVVDAEYNSVSADVESNVTPDAESNSVAADVESNVTPDAESNSVAADVESNVTPDTESNSVAADVESNVTPDAESNSVAADVESNVTPDAELNSNLLDLELSKLLPLKNVVNKNIQIQIKTEEGRLLLILPTESQLPASENNWTEIWQQLKLRLNASDRFQSPNTPVHVIAGDRLLDVRQLQQLAEIFSEVQMQLKSVATSRRQTAIAAVTAGYSVEQTQRENIFSSGSKATKAHQTEALYLEMTVRSGVEIRHPGSVIILGDVNPGGIVVADGDILVWGRLRGVAHAGAAGNRECLIMSLQMEPTQLRIADAVARAPEKLPMQFYPEVAYVTPQGIRIARASDFSKIQIHRMNLEP
jgi:septum site-determining protein MinC